MQTKQKRPGESPGLATAKCYEILSQYTSAKVFEKVLPFVHDGGPKWTVSRTFSLAGFGGINAYRAVSGTTIPTGRIAGQVTNASNGLPVEGAKVSDGTTTATSDTNGNYSIADVPVGDYTVTVSKEGYDTSSCNVSVISAETTTANFALIERVISTKPMWIDNIIFGVRGKNLFIGVSAVGEGEVIAAASVDLQLEWNGGKIWYFSGTTDSSGMVTLKLGKAPDGDYVATVNSFTCSGFSWIKEKGVVSASYTLAR